MNNGQREVQAAPAAATQETAESLLEQVLAATAQTARRFSLNEMSDMADTVARSGLYKMTGAQVMVLMLLCDAEGMHPIEAVRRYHIFDGKISMRSDAMLADFQKAKGRVEWTKDTPTECEAIFSHPVHYPKGKTVSFSWEDAGRAGLTGKDNWKKYPASMLRARVTTNGIRMVLPGVVVGIYTPDEVEEIVAREPPPRQRPPAEPPRRDKSVVEHYPSVAETVERLKAVATPPRPPREPSTEWGKWIAEAVDNFNAKSQTEIKPQQVMNAILTAAIKMELIAEQALLNEKGKRDNAKMAAVMADLWEHETEFIPQATGDYLAGKMVEPTANAEPVQRELTEV